jgi:hypothetical protein
MRGACAAIRSHATRGQQMTTMQSATMNTAERKQPMNVYVRLNQNPTVGIDPDAILGVIDAR